MNLFPASHSRLKQLREAKDISDAIRRIGASPDGDKVIRYLLRTYAMTPGFTPEHAHSAYRAGWRDTALFLANTAYGPDLATKTLTEEMERQEPTNPEE